MNYTCNLNKIVSWDRHASWDFKLDTFVCSLIKLVTSIRVKQRLLILFITLTYICLKICHYFLLKKELLLLIFILFP